MNIQIIESVKVIRHTKYILWAWNTDSRNILFKVKTVTGNIMNFSSAVQMSLNVDMTKRWSTVTIFASLEHRLGLWWQWPNARYCCILANTSGTRYSGSVKQYFCFIYISQGICTLSQHSDFLMLKTTFLYLLWTQADCSFCSLSKNKLHTTAVF